MSIKEHPRVKLVLEAIKHVQSINLPPVNPEMEDLVDEIFARADKAFEDSEPIEERNNVS